MDAKLPDGHWHQDITIPGVGRNWRRLAAAMLVRAVRDAQDEDPALAGPARRWLAKEGVAWAQMLDLSPEHMSGWLSRLPALPWEQLMLPF
jgi:hypothetical protein